MDSSGQCQIKTTWAMAHRRNYGPPVLLETLALYSYMTFENAKVAKIRKGAFFKFKRQQKIFWAQK